MTESSLTIRVEGELKAAFLDEGKRADWAAGQLIRDFIRKYIRRQRETAEYDAFVRHKVRLGQDAAAPPGLFRTKKGNESLPYCERQRVERLRRHEAA